MRVISLDQATAITGYAVFEDGEYLQSGVLDMSRNHDQKNRLKNMMNMVSGAQDPGAMILRMMNNNPQMKQVMDVISAAGGDPRRAFYQLAQQKGVDPQEILDMMK